jgi:hypothetical protein
MLTKKEYIADSKELDTACQELSKHANGGGEAIAAICTLRRRSPCTRPRSLHSDTFQRVAVCCLWWPQSMRVGAFDPKTMTEDKPACAPPTELAQRRAAKLYIRPGLLTAPATVPSLACVDFFFNVADLQEPHSGHSIVNPSPLCAWFPEALIYGQRCAQRLALAQRGSRGSAFKPLPRRDSSPLCRTLKHS